MKRHRESKLILFGGLGLLGLALAAFCFQGIPPEPLREPLPTAIPEEAKVAALPRSGPAEETAPKALAAQLPSPKPEVKRTTLPDGTVVIENHPMMIQVGRDGKLEKRLVTITATPVQKPLRPQARKPAARPKSP